MEGSPLLCETMMMTATTTQTNENNQGEAQ